MRILLGGIDNDDIEVVSALPNDAVVMSASTADELLESVSICSPDILIVNSSLSGLWAGLQSINSMLPVPVVIIADQSKTLDLQNIETMDVYGVLFRPISQLSLAVTIVIARTQFLRLFNAQTEASQLREAFASRKIIDRAKGIIMQRLRMNEGDAYIFLREETRRHRIPIVEVAKALLDDAGEVSTVNPTRSTSATQHSRKVFSTPIRHGIRD